MKWRCDSCAEVHTTEPDECNICGNTSFHTTNGSKLLQLVSWKTVFLAFILFFFSIPSGGGIARSLGAFAGSFVVAYILVKIAGKLYSLSKKAVLRLAYPAEHT